MTFGHGDGGGGPTREMLENIREMGAFPATPRVRQGSVIDFFRALEATSGSSLPTWNGELYLELHRGTYTSQSRNKRANRKSEFLLHDAEFLATLATLLDSGYDYPAARLRRAWELVCLNQFHDILPGSSIGEVYRESLQQYEEISAIGADVRDTALAAIAGRLVGYPSRESRQLLLIANPTSFPRDDLAFWAGHLEAGKCLRRADGSFPALQVTGEGTWISAGELPPLGVTALAIVAGEPPEYSTDLIATTRLLENRYLRVELDGAGEIVRICDKVNRREILPPGAIANQLQAFDDRPAQWDAWDVDITDDEVMWTVDSTASVALVEAGPLRATLEIKRRILHSDYVQRISLAHDSHRLDFDTRIDWRERHILLKAAFPVDILAPQATYEIQWGNVQRPTHRNTSWDWARFEVCAQKWVDLSEGEYGVSVLNDCKYGHDIRDNVLRISLLRSPTDPDPEADQGEHRFAYSLLPHTGSWGTQTIAAAYALNDPLIVMRRALSSRVAKGGPPGGALAASLIALDSPNVVVETVKRAEDGDGIIVRLYESQRQRGIVTLRSGFPLAEVWRCNLLEENQSALLAQGHTVRFPLKPYEIVTLRLKSD